MRLSSLLILAVLSTFLFSCVEDEDFSSNPNLRISFSADTISFDTVFTEAGSSRKILMVYNKNKNALNISSIKVMNPERSGFSVVVDGVAGYEVRDTEILKKDSAYIYIMVKVNPNNSNSPVIISDSIRFELNGTQQYVHLEAIGQDVLRWRGKSIENDTTLTGEKPFLVFDSLIIAKNATLNLKQNVTVYFHNKAKVEVFGKIIATGTVDEPVVFRGDRTDRIFTDVPYDRIPGQWEGMFVDSLSFNNHFEHFHLRNSIVGIQFNPSNLSDQKAVLKNSIIQNSKLDLISAQNCDIKAENCLFANAGGNVMKLTGGKYDFLHCTLANYMKWVSVGGTLSLSNKAGENLIPLVKCEFSNSILSGLGKSSNVVTFDEAKEVPFSHLFNNCLFNINGTDENDDNFFDTVWGEDPKFKFINPDATYHYNFQLDSISPAIDMGNVGKAFLLPYDIIGNSRVSDGGPDIGCYEWIPSGN